MQVSHYNFFVRSFLDDTIIVYNSLTGAYLTLSEAEYEHMSDLLRTVRDTDRIFDANDTLSTTLVKNGFIVSSHEDELALIRQRYSRGRETIRGLRVTLAPTISCNFDCSYCFQEHPKKRLTPESIAALKQHVEGRLDRETSLDVTWFGGEPLLAFDTIVGLCDYFKELCRTRECAFRQSVITNGFLLEPQKADILASYENMTLVQITLDGPPEVHDHRRMTVSKRGTFERILRNIEHAAEKLPISIRVNVDRTNYRRLNDLLQILVDHDLHDRVSLYVAHVLPYTEVCEDVESVALTREEFAQIESQFEFRMLQMGFRSSIRLPAPRYGSLCTADDPSGAVIGPGGLVFQCWNEVAMPAAAASGSLLPVEVGNDRREPPDDSIHSSMGRNRAAWQAYDPFAHEECRECKVQPLCHGGCPWEARKNPSWSTGHCTPLRFNLPDKLRLVHLQDAIQSSCSASWRRDVVRTGSDCQKTSNDENRVRVSVTQSSPHTVEVP